MKDIPKKVFMMEKAYLNMTMEIYISWIIKMIWEMGKELINIEMEINMKDSGRNGKSMMKVLL